MTAEEISKLAKGLKGVYEIRTLGDSVESPRNYLGRSGDLRRRLRPSQHGKIKLLVKEGYELQDLRFRY